MYIFKIVSLSITFIATACFANAGQVIKMSKSGVCHTVDSPYYKKVKHFTPFNSLDSCLDSGGRLSKKQSNKNITTPIERNTKKLSAVYDRKLFPHWIDVDHDCQNTRAEILIRDSLSPVKFKRNKGCNVTWGKWHDPYTDQIFTKASDIDIDHIVPLYHAFKFGADTWTREKRRAFANDPENLIAVEDNANQEKSAQGPDEWMPKNTSFHCTYLKKWQYIKQKYSLSSSLKERQFVSNNLKGCK